ncbi:hypothetical protein [Campylobacter sp. RM16192]|nr:hypothetical protein [Campylobacter sp. RM16192]
MNRDMEKAAENAKKISKIDILKMFQTISDFFKSVQKTIEKSELKR